MSMDAVHKPEKSHHSSAPVVLKNFLNSAANADNQLFALFHGRDRDAEATVPVDTRSEFQNFVERSGQFGETAKQIISEVDRSLEGIIQHYPITDFEPTFAPLDSPLESHRALDVIRNLPSSHQLKMQHKQRGRYYKYRGFFVDKPLILSRPSCPKDILLTVHIMRPQNSYTDHTESIREFRFQCEVKLELRGEMLLSKLKEKIFCQSDFWCDLEDTEDPSDKSNYFMNQFPSSFMFIYDTFYIDRSHPKCVDISEPVREFMKRKKYFGETFTADMAETKVVDLTLRLGQPYVYVHQGHCEHVMIFTDLRLMSPSDAPDMKDYPFRLYDIAKPQICCSCNEKEATIVVTESDRMPLNPAFMCHNCFQSFHYDRGSRLGNFKAYHFIDRGALE